ncbi:outer membrane protein assembly factor BamB family protein [Calycomorphotria hydatis]|uniref:Outer membrane protein assembly factor BamB n=1 Tax=Calycomorphotria hydatis TaxID=2528027 RepID=A0A517TEU6_9PLAN|nr:PQQ-binding-like beta-propeller repeat protein [Calycomorphotria hydatis]QDT66892.1 Outer membrane protein assembly factor BamB precursor [Calycomorphotria hydatis]
MHKLFTSRHMVPSLRTLGVAALLLFVMSLGNTALAQRQRIPSRNYLARFGLERAWMNRATIDASQDIVTQISGDEEVIFVQTRAGVISAYDAESGRKLWTQLSPKVRQHSSKVVTDATHAYAAVGETVYCFNKFNGNIEWQLRIPFVPISEPVFDSERMYIATLNGSVFAFNLALVQERDDEGLLPQYVDETIAWRFNTGIKITAAPVVSNGMVCFTSSNGSLYGLVAENRDQRFQFEINHNVSAPLMARDGVCYMAAEDATMYVIDMTNGLSRWEFVAGQPILKEPILINADLFLLPLRDGLYCIEDGIGRTRWQQKEVHNFLAASVDRVYGDDEFENILIMDRENGRFLGKMPLRDLTVRYVNNRTDRLIFATEDGLIMSLREKGSEFPLYHREPDLRPILPEFAE